MTQLNPTPEPESEYSKALYREVHDGADRPGRQSFEPTPEPHDIFGNGEQYGYPPQNPGEYPDPQPEAQEPKQCECGGDFTKWKEIQDTKNPAKDEVSSVLHDSTEVDAPIVAQDGAQVEGLTPELLTMDLDEFLYSVLPNKLIKLLDDDKFYIQIEKLDAVIKQYFEHRLATATREAYERMGAAIGEDRPENYGFKLRDPAHVNKLRQARNLGYNKRGAEIRQRLAERGNNGRGDGK